MRLTKVEIGGVEVIKWEQERDTVWTYKADDLCACVWAEYGGVWWDVSGPGGKGTKASGNVPLMAPELPVDQRMVLARRFAEVYIAGYRAGKRARNEPRVVRKG